MAYRRRNRTFEAKLAARVDAIKAVRKVPRASSGRQRLISLFHACAKILKAL